jgi:dTDP-4-dehydrorhamnose 3,5-epimerase
MISVRMKASPTSLPGVLILEPKVFGDARGSFYESYRADTFKTLGIVCTFVQENHSTSSQGVLRGLHFQRRQAQDKLVRVVQGEIYDVALDIRRSSPTFGIWAAERLSADNRKIMFVPVGFAHGFLVLSPTAEVIYKTSDFYCPSEERGILWSDPDLGIPWPLAGLTPQVNARDAAYPRLAAAKPDDLPA